MKKIFTGIFLIVAVLTVYFAFQAAKKIRNAKKLQIGISGFNLNLKLNSLAGILDIISNLSALSIPADIEIEIKNFSDSEFSIQQLFVEIFTPAGEKIASPDSPMTKSIYIIPNQTNRFKVKYNLDVSGINKLALQLDNSGNEKERIIQFLKNYFLNGKIGVKITAKGFAKAENINFDIPIKETIDI